MFPTGAQKKFQRREISITVDCTRRVSFVDEKRAQLLSVGLTSEEEPRNSSAPKSQSSYDVVYCHIKTEFTIEELN